MKKIFSIFIILLLIFPAVFADGSFHIYDSDMWRLGREQQQLVAINYQEGFENMLISVDITEDIQGEKAVWIFPVPSNPDKVTIDILKGYPRLSGKDIDSEFNDAVGDVGWYSVGYSLFPISLPFAFFGYFGFFGI